MTPQPYANGKPATLAVAPEGKTVTVCYFALLREQRGLSEERVCTTAATVADLYEELRTAHGFALTEQDLKVVVNEAFAEWTAPLSPHDEVVFIPPVAGG